MKFELKKRIRLQLICLVVLLTSAGYSQEKDISHYIENERVISRPLKTPNHKAVISASKSLYFL